MSELLKLPLLKTKLSNQILESSMGDCILPESFKQNFTEFGEYHIENFNKYTTKVSSKKSTLIIPNQWFYIAGVCCKYHLELIKYRTKLTDYGITDEMFEACHPSKDNKSIPEIEKTLEVCKQKAIKFLSNYDGEDKELLISFLWDYDSWGGGKNIKRSNDFTESPVLNIANTINASSGLIGAIAKAFALRLDVAELLWSSDEWNKIYDDGLTVKSTSKPLPNLPLQQIIYGAPGTGKSFGVDEDVKRYNMTDIRTTFHPDSDYSTFVGAYKPQMEKVIVRDDRGFPVKEEDGKVVYEKKIVYKYTQQAFLKAYVAAWKDLEHPHVLVIEEINRGNCAQIFGDLFQLLDRNDIGFSKYPISADSDIMQALNEEFEGLEIADSEAINAYYKDDVVSDVIEGSRLLLPNNLYIWATMNTSDQSLFPIDSAFKRRWEWKYVPISDAQKGWAISVNGKEYDWWSFLEQINKKIWDATQSEDKKLGYFFCKADRKVQESDAECRIISADKFVGKVLFYIYNDVFKDYGFDDAIFKDGDSELLFHTYFKPDGKPEEQKIEAFLKNLEVKEASDVILDSSTDSQESIEEETIDEMMLSDDNETVGNDNTKYNFEGKEKLGKGQLAIAVVEKYMKEHPNFTFDELKATFPDSMMGNQLKLKGLIVKAIDLENASEKNKKVAYGYYKPERRYKDVNGVEFFVSNYWNITNIQNIIDFAKEQGWNVTHSDN